MIGPIVSGTYDFEGKRTWIHAKRRNVFQPTFPMGRFLSQPLTVRCHGLADVRGFLARCRYVPDSTQFGRQDYWLPPERFEQTRAGDCEDFALWTWRQLIDLGYRSRFVVGRSGRYGAGHAWLHAVIDSRACVVEPLRHWLRKPMPRLSTLRYVPSISVEWDGETCRYFKHRDPEVDPPIAELPSLLAEWLQVWAPLAPKMGWWMLRRSLRLLGRLGSRSHSETPR